MKIAVTGSSGLIGGALSPALREDGHEVLRLVRRTPRTSDEHRWDPQHRRVDEDLLADVDAVINLAGTPIRPRPWTSGYRQSLVSSRLDSTSTVCTAFAEAAAADPGVRGMRRFHELVAAEPRVTATTIQTVGVKGHDGFTLALVTADP